MIRLARYSGWTAVLVFGFSAFLAAQTPPAPGPAAVSFLGGLTSGGSSTGGTVGGTFTFDVSDRLSIETTGAYLDRGRGADGLYGNAGLLVNLLPAGGKAVPYAAIGGGIYYMRFDMDEPHIMGPMVSVGPNPTLGYPNMSGMIRFTTAPSSSTFLGAFVHLPEMYAERLRSMIWPPPRGGWGRRSFTDPAMTIGGGVRLDLTPHLSLRPDARAVVVFGGGRNSTLGMFSLNVGYRF